MVGWGHDDIDRLSRGVGGFGPSGDVMSDSWYSGVDNRRYSGLELSSRGGAVIPVKMEAGGSGMDSRSADGANI